MNQLEKAQKLGNQVLNNPKLLNQLDEDTFLKFVISISKYDKPLAWNVFDLKVNGLSAQNKILFWEAVGLVLEN
jgi:hypothetical protein